MRIHDAQPRPEYYANPWPTQRQNKGWDHDCKKNNVAHLSAPNSPGNMTDDVTKFARLFSRNVVHQFEIDFNNGTEPLPEAIHDQGCCIR
jgi:hypothetical protein